MGFDEIRELYYVCTYQNSLPRWTLQRLKYRSQMSQLSNTSHTDSHLSLSDWPLLKRMSVVFSAAAQTATSTATRYVTNTDAPITQLIPYITTAFTWFKYFLSSLSSFRPFLFWPLPILLYILAPVIVFSEVVATIIFYGPYKITLYLLDALYPLYVLIGVACITGGVLGFAGRQLCRFLVHLLQEGKNSN